MHTGRNIRRVALAGIATLLLTGAAFATDAPATRTKPAEPEAAAAAAKPESELTGKDIYARVLENRFAAYTQESALVSGDRGGSDQEMRLRMWFKSFRDDTADTDEIGKTNSKTLVKYTHPFELRHSGYLVINNHARPNDQFVYRASSRRVQRVNLRGEAVFGTDFSFEDIIPRELEDSDYTRGPDEECDGLPCFVIDAIPRDLTDSEYSRFRIYVDKKRFVPLRTRYWDDREIEFKELTTDPESIESVDGVWLARRMTMRNLRFESFTSLEVTKLDGNPTFGDTTFDLRRLESR